MVLFWVPCLDFLACASHHGSVLIKYTCPHATYGRCHACHNEHYEPVPTSTPKKNAGETDMLNEDGPEVPAVHVCFGKKISYLFVHFSKQADRYWTTSFSSGPEPVSTLHGDQRVQALLWTYQSSALFVGKIDRHIGQVSLLCFLHKR